MPFPGHPRLSWRRGTHEFTRKSEERLLVLVVRSGRGHVGLVVDAIIDGQDLLLKPIPRHLGETPCVSGVSILGDDRICVLLHVPGVVDSMKGRAGLQPVGVKRSERSMGKAILVVDDSLNTREIEKIVGEREGLAPGVIYHQGRVEYRGKNVVILGLARVFGRVLEREGG